MIRLTKFSLSIMMVFAASFGARAQNPPSFTISTVAGNGVRGFAGDEGQAADAQLSGPTAIALDRAGNLYVCDNGNNRIRKIDPAGKITTFAGNGTRGFSGDGGPAVNAQLNSPYGVQVDPKGNVLVADQGNNRIRRITPDGIINTVAGNGQPEFNGDNIPASSASINHPDDALADQKGNIFIADTGNNRVRKVGADGTITTIAGTGQLRYNGEGGYSGDGGPAVKARLYVPAVLLFDRDGNLYVGDFRNQVIRKITPDGIIRTVAGTGQSGFNGDGILATTARLNEPGGIALGPDGALLLTDGLNFRIRRINADGMIQTIAGTGKRAYAGDGGPALKADLSVLDGLIVDPTGNIYFADFSNNRVRRLTPASKAFVAEGATGALIGRMRSAYAALKSVRLKYTFRRAFDRHPNSPTGTIEFLAPNKLRGELTLPDYGTVSVVDDGRSITTLDAQDAQPDVRDATLANLSRMIPGNLEIRCLYEWDQQLGPNFEGSKLEVKDAQTWNSREWTVLEERPADGHVVISYFVDPKTALIWRTEVRNAQTNEVMYDGSIDTLEINPSIPLQRFNAAGR